MSISGQIVSEMLTGYTQKNSIQTLVIFWVSTKENLEGFVWSFLSITGLRSQRQFAPKCSFLANPIISEISFLWRHRFSTLLDWAKMCRAIVSGIIVGDAGQLLVNIFPCP